MSRPKGLPKTGGRKKGYPFYKNGMPAQQLLDELKHNPITCLVRIAEDKNTPPQLVAYCEDKLAKYVKPQLSAVAYTDKDGNSIQPVTLVFQAVASPPTPTDDERNG